MAKARQVKRAKFGRSVFDGGAVKFEAGQSYDLTDETRREIRRGNAVEVDEKAPAELDLAGE